MKHFKFRINGNIYQVDIHNFEGNLAELEVNGTPYKVELEKEMAVSKTPKLVRAKTPKPTSEAFQPLSSGDKINEVKAPLPGSVLEISVKEGDQVVTSGQMKLKSGDHVAINNKVEPTNEAFPQPIDD